MLPVLPATMTSPWLVYVTSQPAGLKPAFVVKLPCLNCSTIVIIPLESVLTVNSRLNVSSAQSLPHRGGLTLPGLPRRRQGSTENVVDTW